MYKNILEFINRKVMLFRLIQAKILADQQKQLTGKTHIVVLVGKRYFVLNNHDRKLINQRNHKSNRISFVSMLENAVYITK